MMQGACLFFIYLTLQAGLMVQNTLPDRNTGDAILVALSVANIFLLVSPVLLGLIAALQILPESIRRHASVFFGGPGGVAGDKPVPEGEQLDAAPSELDGWDSADVPPDLASAELETADAAAVAFDADAMHIELTALNTNALQLADTDAWQGSTVFGPSPSAAPAAAGTLFPPTAAAEEGPRRAHGAQSRWPESSFPLTTE